MGKQPAYDDLYIAYHNDPDWPDVDKIKRRVEAEAKKKEDEEDTPTRENVPKLSEHPAVQRKLTINEEAKQASISTKTAIDFMDKYYGDITDDGVYKILNFRIPGKMQEMTRKNFMESTEAWSLTITVEGSPNPKTVSYAQLWLKYVDKRSWDQFVFDPSYEFDPNVTRKGDFNRWPGFATKPKKGNCRRFLRYMKYVICAGNKEHFRWLCAWVAQMIQDPAHKPGTAVILIGPKGIGKSFFGKKLNKLLGDDLCFTTAHRDDLFGNWNDHLEHTIFLQLEEAIWAGNKREMSELNEFITGMKLSTRARFKSTKRSNSFTRTLLDANPGDFNEHWIVPATFDERRYTALYVSAAHQKDKVGYFDPIDEELESGGYEALMYFFMNFDISGYDLSTGLETKALMDQKIKTATAMKGPKGWWINVLHERELSFIDVVDANGISVAPSVKSDVKGNVVFNDFSTRTFDDEIELIGEYYYVGKEKLRQSYAKSIGKKVDEIEPRAFGLEFNSFFPELDERGNIVKINNERRIKSVLEEGKSKGGRIERMKIYKIPKLAICRKMMNAVIGHDIDWDDMRQEWEKKEFKS